MSLKYLIYTYYAINNCSITHADAIQANMDVKDTQYFNQVLKLNAAYRISRFSCEEARKWQCTLDYKPYMYIPSCLKSVIF